MEVNRTVDSQKPTYLFQGTWYRAGTLVKESSTVIASMKDEGSDTYLFKLEIRVSFIQFTSAQDQIINSQF